MTVELRKQLEEYFMQFFKPEVRPGMVDFMNAELDEIEGDPERLERVLHNMELWERDRPKITKDKLLELRKRAAELNELYRREDLRQKIMLRRLHKMPVGVNRKMLQDEIDLRQRYLWELNAKRAGAKTDLFHAEAEYSRTEAGKAETEQVRIQHEARCREAQEQNISGGAAELAKARIDEVMAEITDCYEQLKKSNLHGEYDGLYVKHKRLQNELSELYEYVGLLGEPFYPHG